MSASILSAWESTRVSFASATESKHMSYSQHLIDMLWADAHVLVCGAGMAVHTVFPQVFAGSEAALHDLLADRRRVAIDRGEIAAACAAPAADATPTTPYPD